MEEDLRRSKQSMSALREKDASKIDRRRSSVAFGSRSLSRMKMRKQSYGFGGVPGIRPVERTSQVAIEFKRPPLVFLNTYQLDPHPEGKFHVPKVRQATDDILDENWNGHKYNVQESPSLALRLAGEIMRKIKTMQFNRYRIITVVTIGQKRSQSYNNAISFIWDYERDDYVDIQREESTSFIQVTTFGIYLD